MTRKEHQLRILLDVEQTNNRKELARLRAIEAAARDYAVEVKRHGDLITKYAVRQAFYDALEAKA